MIEKLAESGSANGKTNVAFLSQFMLGNIDACLNLLVNTNRIPEATFFAKTYAPSRLQSMLGLWKTHVATISEKASQSLADPVEYGNLFPNFSSSLASEQALLQQSSSRMEKDFPTLKVSHIYIQK